jgi:hypothetical protein
MQMLEGEMTWVASPESAAGQKATPLFKPHEV